MIYHKFGFLCSRFKQKICRKWIRVWKALKWNHIFFINRLYLLLLLSSISLFLKYNTTESKETKIKPLLKRWNCVITYSEVCIARNETFLKIILTAIITEKQFYNKSLSSLWRLFCFWISTQHLSVFQIHRQIFIN